MMHRRSVLVFTIRDLSRQNPSTVHGSILWTENLLESLAQVSGTTFTIVSSMPNSNGVANQRFAQALGFDHEFVPFRSFPEQTGIQAHQRPGMTINLWGLLADKYYFNFERVSRNQKHIDAALMEIIREKRPDLVVLNEIHAAFYTPSVFKLETPCCLISVNNEISFHKTTKANAGPVGESMQHKIGRWIYRHGNWISNRRFQQYATSVYEQCAGIVVLTHGDLPDDLPDHIVRAVIPPIFKRNALQWRHQGTGSIFFVGNIMTYSNRLAIDWLCTHFAPELSRIDENVRINIVGASTDQVPREWLRSNVNFMGYADGEQVNREMTAADLFIAPIANPYGAKLKVAECVSHATPLLATHAALSGIPFRASMPLIDLDQPAAAARLAVDYITRPALLTELSRSIDAHAAQARMDQTAAWDAFLGFAMGMNDECEAG